MLYIIYMLNNMNSVAKKTYVSIGCWGVCLIHLLKSVIASLLL